MAASTTTQTVPTRTLGSRGLSVSALGLFFHTAMCYGSGHNEQLLGRALVGRRNGVVLASKVDTVRDPAGRVAAHRSSRRPA